MAQTVKITPALGTLEFIGNTSLAASTSAIFTGDTAGSIALAFPAAQGIEITGFVTVIGNITATAFIKSGGTAAQFLKADGSVDSAVYALASRTLTINNVAYDLTADRSWTISTADGYISDVQLTGNELRFTGEGSAFSGSIDLSSIIPTEQDTLDSVTDRGNITTNTIDVGGAKSDYFLLDIAASPTQEAGMFYWNDRDDTANLRLSDGVDLRIGQDLVWYVKAGVEITKGQVVMAAGTDATSGHIIAAPMIADGSVEERYVLGIATKSVDVGSFTHVVAFGKVYKLDILTGFQAGSVLFCDPSVPGGLTDVQPTAPELSIPIAFVVNNQQNNGILAVRVLPGYHLGELHDVKIDSGVTGQLLRYNVNRWENWTPNYATTTYVDTSISNLIDLAPDALNTLNELAAALGDDPNFATTITTAISGKVAKAGDTMTGDLDLQDNQLLFNQGNVSAPSTTDQHAGSRIVLYPLASGSHYAIGIEGGNMWFNTDGGFKWYQDATTLGMSLNSNSDLSVVGRLSATGYNDSNWNTAYNDKINSASFNTADGILTLTQQDGGTVTVDLDGRYLTSETDSQTLSWDLESQVLSISDGNSVDLRDLATQDFVTGQGYLTTETDPYRVTAASVTGTSTKTLTITRADSSTVTTTWTDYDTDTNTYVTSAAFNTGNGVLTLTRNDAGTVTVDLDGRYSEIGHTHALSVNDSGYINIAGSEASIYSIDSRDRRALVDLPSTFNRGLYLDFKNPQIFPELTADGYKGQMIWRAYGSTTDMSGGYPMQIVYDQVGDIHYRLGVSLTAWQEAFATIASQQWVQAQSYLTALPSHNHDDRYYTETETGQFFAGTTAITGYNKTNWDAAYGDKINSASFNTADGILTLTQQDGGTVTVDLDGRYLTSETDSQTLSWDAGAKELTISSGNSVTLDGLATEEFVTGQGYLTSYSEVDTLSSVTARGASTPDNIGIGATTGGDRGLGIYYGADGSDYGRIRFYQNNSNHSTIHSFANNWQSGNIFNASSGAINITGQTGVTFGGWSAIDAAIAVGGQSYFRGSMGVGTTSPREKLDVDGNIVTTWGNDRFIGLQFQTGGEYRNGLLLHGDNRSTGILAKAGSGSDPYIWFGGGVGTTSEWVRINKEGKVGINTNSPTARLTVNGSTAGESLFEIYGTNGLLFAVNDDLSNSLFSANTIAGLPVIEAFADGSVVMGPFATPVTVTTTGQINTTSHGNSSQWIAGYNDRIVSASVSGGPTKTLTLTQQDGGTLTASWSDTDTDTNTYLTSAAFNTTTGVLTLTRNDSATVTVDLDDRYLTSYENNYISAVALNESILRFTGEGSGFTGDIDLSALGYLTSYTETDTLATVTARGNVTNGSITVQGGMGAAETTDGYGLEIMGNYTNGQYNHRLSKFDKNGGVPLYVQFTTGTANVWSNSARFGVYSGNGYEFEVYGAAKVNGDFASTGQINASGGNSANWNAAYNDKINSASFNTADGILTLTQQDGGTVTVDLDGRYLTSETDSQTLSWDAGAKELTISSGNSVTLDGLATEEFVTGQGYLTSYTEADTLNSVTTRGNTTTNSISVGTITASGVGNDGGEVIRILGSASDAFNYSTASVWGNLTAGETVAHVIGKAESQYNTANFGYRHVADGSSSNHVTIGMFQADNLLNILGNGNVGIATTNPSYKLHVVGSIYAADQMYINNSSPTLYLVDTDNRSAMVHVNSNYFYVLNGSGTNTTGWAQQANSRWALTINLDTNYTTFGGIGDFPTEVYAGGSFRAPIFYDLIDTNYYVDPNSQSVLYNVQVSNVLRVGPNYHIQQNANGDLEFKYI